MMAQLKNLTRNSVLATHVKQAKTFWMRTRGLLGTNEFAIGSALWIHRCNSIHTFFMRYPIDAIFVDTSLQVRAVHSHIRPWSMILPHWRASSVFELPAGTLDHYSVFEGDQLHVDP